MSRAKRKWLRRYMEAMRRQGLTSWTHEANVGKYRKQHYYKRITGQVRVSLV